MSKLFCDVNKLAQQFKNLVKKFRGAEAGPSITLAQGRDEFTLCIIEVADGSASAAFHIDPDIMTLCVPDSNASLSWAWSTVGPLDYCRSQFCHPPSTHRQRKRGTCSPVTTLWLALPGPTPAGE